MKKTLGVFELGLLPEPLADAYPDYAQMIVDWLCPSLPEVDYVPLRPLRGEPIPPPGAYDGYLYSGSKYGVYDDEPWIGPMKRFVAAAAAQNIPQFGICFGHQLLAEALGGRVVKTDRGWGCGRQRYRVRFNAEERDAPTGDIEDVNVLVIHQDQVVGLPPAVDLLGGNDFCRHGVFAYPQPALSVQFHPEFSNAFVADLLKLPGGIGLDPAAVEAALASLDGPPDNARIAAWAAAFFRRHFARLSA